MSATADVFAHCTGEPALVNLHTAAGTGNAMGSLIAAPRSNTPLIWTAAQHKLPIVFVVMRSGEYSVLKSFALLEKTSNVPGLNFPGLDIGSLAVGFGCHAVTVDGTQQLAKEFNAALGADGPTVIVVPAKPHIGRLG